MTVGQANMKVRLDMALVERGFLPSRMRAQALIKEGGVFVNGQKVEDQDFKVRTKDTIVLGKEDIPWVSRAGLKLEQGIARWKILPKGKIALDIGASTGGFTDVLLANGAKKVYALDVGHGQLAEKLRKHKQVVNMEGTHINTVSAASFKERLDIIVVDVSFISLEKVLPKVKELLRMKGTLIALIKPQFEVGKALVKKGVVTDPKLHTEVVQRIERAIEGLGFAVEGLMASPVLGGDGNKEFLIYAQRV